jgi:hypothetical protein
VDTVHGGRNRDTLDGSTTVVSEAEEQEAASKRWSETRFMTAAAATRMAVTATCVRGIN